MADSMAPEMGGPSATVEGKVRLMEAKLEAAKQSAAAAKAKQAAAKVKAKKAAAKVKAKKAAQPNRKWKPAFRVEDKPKAKVIDVKIERVDEDFIEFLPTRILNILKAKAILAAVEEMVRPRVEIKPSDKMVAEVDQEEGESGFATMLARRRRELAYESNMPTDALQIFSLKVAKIWGGLQWPLHVFGMVAVHDAADHNRNMIFHRPRECCQILTQEDPYLKLTGPTRAVVLDGPVTLEVDLQVKGVTQDEDESMSSLAVTYNDYAPLRSRFFKIDYDSKLSTVEFELGSVVKSVEATISLRVIAGSWPSGFCARISACDVATRLFCPPEVLAKAVVILLDCGHDEIRFSRDTILLSRCVASVELSGKLLVYVKADRGEGIEVGRSSFKPQKNGASHHILELGTSCKLLVTVAWSLGYCAASAMNSNRSAIVDFRSNLSAAAEEDLVDERYAYAGQTAAAVMNSNRSAKVDVQSNLSAAAEKDPVDERCASKKISEKPPKMMVAVDSERKLGPNPFCASEAAIFRDVWNERYGGYCGHFEDTTKIPNMCFTYKTPKLHDCFSPTATLQIFSLKVANIWGGLQWPLHVFGMVAVRDVIDHNRNMIFHRPRECCQILTQEDPYLRLTGPTRAVVLVDPVTIEVDLQVKGVTQDEDESMSFLAVTYDDSSLLWSRRCKMDYASKLSTVEFELGSIVMSVEATISLRVRTGWSWPSGFRARISARLASLGKAEVILLDCGYDEICFSRSGVISLSRCVASVEIFGKLVVYVKAERGEEIEVGRRSFEPQKDGVRHQILDLGSKCSLDVTVAWSLASTGFHGSTSVSKAKPRPAAVPARLGKPAALSPRR